jgi:origin recognition complex subunit 1
MTQDCAVFDEEAILFAARKTAAVSGDVRKAFHICRSAAEMVLNKHLQSIDKTSLPRQNEVGHPVVKIPDVQRVSREASDSCLSKAVAQATPFEALLLISLSSLSRSTGRERNGFDIEEVMTKMESVAGSFGDEQYTPPPRFEETLFMLNRLADAQIINLRTPTNASMSFRSSLTGMGGAWPIASLLMDGTNILLALRGTKHNALAQKYLAKSAF